MNLSSLPFSLFFIGGLVTSNALTAESTSSNPSRKAKNIGKGTAPANTPQQQAPLAPPSLSQESTPINSGTTFEGHSIISSFKDSKGITWGVFEEDGHTWAINSLGQKTLLDQASHPIQKEEKTNPPNFTNQEGLNTNTENVPAFGWNQMPPTFTDQAGVTWTTFVDKNGQTWGVNQFGDFIKLPPQKKSASSEE